MAHVVEPPSAEVTALEQQTLQLIEQSDLSDLLAAGRKSLRIPQIADSLVWGLANNSDTMVPQTVNEVAAALQSVTRRPIDQANLTVEVQCLLAWRGRSIIEAVTGLADGGQLGAEYRRWYAHRLRRMQCGLPPARVIDQRLDDYTRVVSGEQFVFSWAAALFASLVVPVGATVDAVHAVQRVAVDRIVWSYCTNVITFSELYANAKR
jgi:hypothetical protein